ncbi:MAG TPA: aconitase X catalytic domain-containing protein [Anaerolineae bacterium]|nr:aconitase X catalytic domain-containing protein [Anaerolineae bacterium]
MAETLGLTDEESDILAGDQGPGQQKAMAIVVALAKIYGAADLVPVESAQISGVSYKNLGQAGLEFLQEWAAMGARARIPATLNPAGADMQAWRALGFEETFIKKQRAVVDAYATLGVLPTLTCTPYQTGTLPALGQHLAWAESSAVTYANSVLGARTNREGGPSALAAAIAGRTARAGLHLDEARQPTALFDVRCPLASEADLGALGIMIGSQVRHGVPYLRLAAGLPPGADLKTLGAAMAASGAIGLYHIEGLTAEARGGTVEATGLQPSSIDSLRSGYHVLDGSAAEIDLVSIGCPHASLAEIALIADALQGRTLRAQLWVTTARPIRDGAVRAGLVSRIEESGGRVVADTCLVVAPVAALGFRSLATNSAKMAFYAPSHSGLSVRFGPLERCVEATITGRWRP